MNKLEKTQMLIYAMQYANLNNTQQDIVERMLQKETYDLYERHCLEEMVCPVCGGPLNPEGELLSFDDLGQRSQRVISTICNNVNCSYNKELEKRLSMPYEEVRRRGYKKIQEMWVHNGFTKFTKF